MLELSTTDSAVMDACYSTRGQPGSRTEQLEVELRRLRHLVNTYGQLDTCRETNHKYNSHTPNWLHPSPVPDASCKRCQNCKCFFSAPTAAPFHQQLIYHKHALRKERPQEHALIVELRALKQAYEDSQESDARLVRSLENIILDARAILHEESEVTRSSAFQHGRSALRRYTDNPAFKRAMAIKSKHQ